MANKKEKTRKGPTQSSIKQYKSILSQMSTSQNKKILKHLVRYGKITTMQAYEKFGCTRCPARIADLREMDIDIETEIKWKKTEDGWKHYGIYHLK